MALAPSTGLPEMCSSWDSLCSAMTSPVQSGGHLVANLVAILVDNTIQRPNKIGNEQQLKRLKRQHGQLLNRPHNPKVGGSNPSPASKGG